jgi:hypothetical protein
MLSPTFDAEVRLLPPHAAGVMVGSHCFSKQLGFATLVLSTIATTNHFAQPQVDRI